jgi:hypothetical protein
LRRTKATLIYRRTKTPRAVQVLLGHRKLESTVRYLGVEVEDVLEISEQTEVWAVARAGRDGFSDPPRPASNSKNSRHTREPEPSIPGTPGEGGKPANYRPTPVTGKGCSTLEADFGVTGGVTVGGFPCGATVGRTGSVPPSKSPLNDISSLNCERNESGPSHPDNSRLTRSTGS